MATKIEAARIAMQAGCHMIIASGKIDHPLRALRSGAPCTWFDAQATPRTARKRWIAGSLKPAGKIVVDAGAAAALAAGKSLLPAGVIAVTGEFDRGEAVIVTDHLGDELARGLTAYSAQAARAIMGRKSSEIENILGYRGRVELIHRDDLVLEQF